jgi:hypothetical protein
MIESDLVALSVRYPWIDMILDGEKVIEVREWTYPPSRRGTFILHAAWTIDWKTIALLDLDPPLNRPRGAFVGCADLLDTIEMSASTNWRELMPQHRVIHPPVGDRTVWGLVLGNVRRFRRPIKGAGRSYFFPVPASVRDTLLQENPGADATPSSELAAPRVGRG